MLYTSGTTGLPKGIAREPASPAQVQATLAMGRLALGIEHGFFSFNCGCCRCEGREAGSSAVDPDSDSTCGTPRRRDSTTPVARDPKGRVFSLRSDRYQIARQHSRAYRARPDRRRSR
jgi:hypothetical protein